MLYIQMLWFSIRRINQRIIACFILSLMLSVSDVARAGYKPPNPPPPPPTDHSRTTGQRGCPGESTPITAISPYTHVGYTVSTRPTFVWFVSSPHKTVFRLFEVNEVESKTTPVKTTLKQIGEQISNQSSPGINKLSLPESYPALSVGKRYIWQVAIFCPDALIVRSEFMVVEMSPALRSRLSNKMNSIAKANLYADAGLWYDALAEALKLAKNRKLGELGSTLVNSLAQSEKAVGTPEEQQEIRQRINNLQDIAKKQL